MLFAEVLHPCGVLHLINVNFCAGFTTFTYCKSTFLMEKALVWAFMCPQT